MYEKYFMWKRMICACVCRIHFYELSACMHNRTCLKQQGNKLLLSVWNIHSGMQQRTRQQQAQFCRQICVCEWEGFCKTAGHSLRCVMQKCCKATSKSSPTKLEKPPHVMCFPNTQKQLLRKGKQRLSMSSGTRRTQEKMVGRAYARFACISRTRGTMHGLRPHRQGVLIHSHT